MAGPSLKGESWGSWLVYSCCNSRVLPPLQVLNERAIAVMGRMSDKLTGRDFPTELRNGADHDSIPVQARRAPGLEIGHPQCSVVLRLSALNPSCDTRPRNFSLL